MKRRRPFSSSSHDCRPAAWPRACRALACAFIVLLSACRDDTLAPDDPRNNPADYNPDWSSFTHERGAPNYDVIFPQQTVNTIEIVMTPAQWDSIRANMRRLTGVDFGQTGGQGGGFPNAEPEYVDVTLRFNGKQWKHVGFRLKGNSSLNSAWRQGNYKLPFRLHFDRFEDQYPIEDQRIYGFRELSMSPGWSDLSLIREKLAADIFRQAGIPAARTAFYRVFIDFGTGLKYCGVYTAVEVIDDTMVEDQFGDDSGNIYKPESRFQTFVQTQFEKKNNESPPDYSDVIAFINALNSPTRTSNPAGWRNALEATFDVDHFLKWLAANNAMVNWDTYGAIPHNYYLYHHPSNRLTWIPWDHNMSLSGSPGITGTIGGTPGGPGGAPRIGLSLSMNEVVATQWPLLRYVADDPTYYARYRTHMRTFIDNVFTESNIYAMIDRYHSMISSYVIGPNGEQPGYSYIINAAAFTSAAASLRLHVTSRINLVRSFVP